MSRLKRLIQIAGFAAVAMLALGGGLSQRITAPLQSTEPAPSPAPSTVAPSAGPSVVRFGPDQSQDQFDQLLGNMSVDVIEMESGIYRGWHLRFVHDRAARPLLVRPARGADVVWDGTGGTTGDALFYVGWGPGYRPSDTITDYITFDPAGTGGTFSIENYDLGQQGLIATFWADHVAFNGFRTRNISGVAPGWLSWQVYVSSDGVHSGSNLTFNDWDVGPSVDRTVGGLQTGNDPQADNVTALGWRITGAKSAMTLYGSVTGLRIENWLISNCDYAVTSDGNAAGQLRNNRSTGSANSPVIKPPLVDAGGNSWG